MRKIALIIIIIGFFFLPIYGKTAIGLSSSLESFNFEEVDWPFFSMSFGFSGNMVPAPLESGLCINAQGLLPFHSTIYKKKQQVYGIIINTSFLYGYTFAPGFQEKANCFLLTFAAGVHTGVRVLDTPNASLKMFNLGPATSFILGGTDDWRRLCVELYVPVASFNDFESKSTKTSTSYKIKGKLSLTINMLWTF